MVKAKTVAVDIWKKKRWYPIYATKSFNDAFLGETPALEPEMVKGRKVEGSMALLTGDLKKQGYSITFKISEVKDNRAIAVPIMFEIKPYAIRKFIRKNCTRVDDSFVAQTSDNKFVRIKPLIIISKRVSKSIQTLIRKHVSDIIIKELKKRTVEEAIVDIALGKFQKIVYDRIRKITTIKVTEIRMISVIEDPKKAKKARREEEEKIIEEEEEILEEESEKELESEESEESGVIKESEEEREEESEDLSEDKK